MKHLLLTTVAAVLLVGCGPQPPDISIHSAALFGNIEAIKQHLAAGTDVNAKDTRRGYVTPLHCAAIHDHKEIVELLIANGADVPPLAAVSTKEIAELLIARGADVNAKAAGGWTALYRAAGGNANIALVEFLIAKGADVNAKADGGWTPLHRAAEQGHTKIAELLITKGANVNAQGLGVNRNFFETPLDRAEFMDIARFNPKVKAAKKETADFLRKHGGKTGEELKAAAK